MTFLYNNVYLNEVSTITGPYEAKGPFNKLYDKSYNEFYFGKNNMWLKINYFIYKLKNYFKFKKAGKV